MKNTDELLGDIERQASTGPLRNYNPLAIVTCPHCGGTMQAIDAKAHVYTAGDTKARINELLGHMRARSDEHGLSARCPVCNAGIGKWCRDESGQTVRHPARVAIAEPMTPPATYR